MDLTIVFKKGVPKKAPELIKDLFACINPGKGFTFVYSKSETHLRVQSERVKEGF